MRLRWTSIVSGLSACTRCRRVIVHDVMVLIDIERLWGITKSFYRKPMQAIDIIEKISQFGLLVGQNRDERIKSLYYTAILYTLNLWVSK